MKQGTKKALAYVSSFLFGGAFALIALLLHRAIAPLVPAELADPLTLAGLGFLGALMFLLGLQEKIDHYAGAAAFTSLNGFSAAVAGVYFQTRVAGRSVLHAFFEGFMLLLKVILFGSAIVMVLAVLFWLLA